MLAAVVVRCLAAALAWASRGEVLEDEGVGHFCFCSLLLFVDRRRIGGCLKVEVVLLMMGF